MLEHGARLARVLLAQQPTSLLLIDRDDELLGCIEALLPDSVDVAAKPQMQRIDPLSNLGALAEESTDVLDGNEQSPAALLQRIPVLLTADLIYIADIYELAAGLSMLSANETPEQGATVPMVLLGALRDRVRGALFVAFNPASGNVESVAKTPADVPSLAKSDFMALGFVEATPAHVEPGKGCDAQIQPASGKAPTESLFRYSLRDYKAVPGWLNSKYWANPERWNIVD